MREGILAAADAVTRQTGVEKPNVLGYCVGGTLLGTTLAWLAGKRHRPLSLGDVPHRADRFLQGRRPPGVHRRCAAEVARGDDDRARLPRRLAHGERLQHAAAARSDLALHRQQLPARQEAVRVRPAVLEPGFDAHAGGQPRLLSARVLSREQSRARPHGARWRAARSVKGEAAGLRAGDARGPHRARRDRSSSAPSCFGGPVRYVLAGSGHIAGVVNPPDKVKYQHWIASACAPTLEDWLETARGASGLLVAGLDRLAPRRTPAAAFRRASQARASSRHSRMRRAAM